ncbi:hypothetical protein GOBAR_AA34713 [Gossypium barbadense]|uniref:Uncharacterized protein n=1 Tax=Gossypium barbadense TaxID=3634 RepID=A0A2P5W4K7_GOSBA|nr:hypothetical protein GOBAR_AA34713 [Gossypium barbadense]
MEETLADLTIKEDEEVEIPLDLEVDADRIVAGVIGVSTLTFLLCIGSRALAKRVAASSSIWLREEMGYNGSTARVSNLTNWGMRLG